jgi:hypothetical protein
MVELCSTKTIRLEWRFKNRHLSGSWKPVEEEVVLFRHLGRVAALKLQLVLQVPRVEALALELEPILLISFARCLEK